MSVLGSSQMAAPDPEKADSAAESARVLVAAVRNNLRPRDIITRKSIENAIALVMATGGSTNAVLHYLAIAHAAGVKWTIDDFERVRRKVPVLCDLKPVGALRRGRPASRGRRSAGAQDPACQRLCCTAIA
jgi:dihydroxy-acid dehydratase